MVNINFLTADRLFFCLSLRTMCSAIVLTRNSLFVATRTDTASLNIANHLLEKHKWECLETKKNECMSIVSASGNIVFLWLVNEPLLHLNRPNTLFLEDLTCADEHKEAEYGVNEVFFLSRHVASSGTLSLTVHPIGIPWLLDSTTSGGIPGKCSPPNRRISSLFRSILGETKFRNLENKYQVTLEATHHGPHVDLPTCFVEIGSSENEWSDADAGDILADCLAKEFEFTHQQPPLEVDSNTNIVVISIGGGHYVPKMNDLVTCDIINNINNPIL